MAKPVDYEEIKNIGFGDYEIGLEIVNKAAERLKEAIDNDMSDGFTLTSTNSV